VTFVHRKTEHKKYQPTGYTISCDDFIEQVQGFVQLSSDFQQAVGLTRKEIADFASRALPIAKKEGKKAHG
jgi:hypothetical protein